MDQKNDKPTAKPIKKLTLADLQQVVGGLRRAEVEAGGEWTMNGQTIRDAPIRG